MSMRAAFFDIDGTLTSERTWKGIMDYFTHNHLRRGMHLAFLGAHYPLYYLRRFGLISESAFRSPWAAHLAWYVRGYTPQEAEAIWDWVVKEFLSNHWRMDARRLLDDHRTRGDPVMLVSAGPQPLLERIAREVGASHVVATEFELREGCYTGHSLEPVCIDENKAALAKAYLDRRDIEVDFLASYAYADAISDLHLLDMVGNPVAVYPDEELGRVAKERGWKVFPADS